ncbi:MULTISPECIES: hypothetical protein [unclassified Streptomyces]|uniref:hypothetical protein n=1 Tax=unclassified Streptomyces TaxID=2593676 RepID=UPI001F543291|nr:MULTISPECIES: hypothetical protein [unclassified Streptomyces]
MSDETDPRDVHVELSGLGLGTPPWAPNSPVVRALEQTEALEGDLVAVLRVDCPGTWLEPVRSHRAEKLFAIQVEVWGGTLLVVTLETFSDAWLTMDTRGREQPDVHALNAPRLAAALDGISTFLGTPPMPGDENRYATPNETGFADPRIEGPAYDDAWGTFERLDRTRLLDARLPRCDEEYEQVTEAPVRYTTVRRDGVTLGYVWAATDDSAAGYVPRTAAGDAAFDAGAVWLSSLREACSEGLRPLRALDRLARRPAGPQAGVVSAAAFATAPSLDALEELSGRD